MTHWQAKDERNAAFLRAIHGIEAEEPPPEPEGQSKPDFDGGVREPAPLPPDPIGDHNEIVAELLRAKELDEW